MRNPNGPLHGERPCLHHFPGSANISQLHTSGEGPVSTPPEWRHGQNDAAEENKESVHWLLAEGGYLERGRKEGWIRGCPRRGSVG